jgi:hypothetical protein
VGAVPVSEGGSRDVGVSSIADVCWCAVENPMQQGSEQRNSSDMTSAAPLACLLVCRSNYSTAYLARTGMYQQC